MIDQSQITDSEALDRWAKIRAAKFPHPLPGDQRLLSRPYILHTGLGPFPGARLLIAKQESQEWYGRYQSGHELQTCAALGFLRAGDTVWDIGGNIGSFGVLSALLAGPEGRILSFDPFPVNCELHRINAMLNGVSERITVHNFGAWEKDEGRRVDEASQEVSSRGSGASIELRRLDSVPGLPRPDFLKMDIEGAEVHALRGLRGALPSLRAAYIEYHPSRVEHFGWNGNEAWRAMIAELEQAGRWYFYSHENGWHALDVHRDESVYLFASREPVEKQVYSA